LRAAWKDLDLTVGEGINSLSMITAYKIRPADATGATINHIPFPNNAQKKLLMPIDVHLPEFLPHQEVNLLTTRHLLNRRK